MGSRQGGAGLLTKHLEEAAISIPVDYNSSLSVEGWRRSFDFTNQGAWCFRLKANTSSTTLLLGNFCGIRV